MGMKLKSSPILGFVKLFIRWLIYLNLVVIIGSQNTKSTPKPENFEGEGEGHKDTVWGLGGRGGRDVSERQDDEELHTEDDQVPVQCTTTREPETNFDDYDPLKCMKKCKKQSFAMVTWTENGHRCKCQN